VGRVAPNGELWQEVEVSRMLVLSRKKNESIVINNDITIVVVEIRGDKVRLGVEAPKEVPVHRREVFDAIRRSEAAGEKKEPSQADPAKAPGDS
jgi:carbon storage regulator